MLRQPDPVDDIREERTDRRQPGIAGGRGVATLVLQIFEKREDSFWSEVIIGQLRYLPARELDEMPKKKSETIPVTGDGVRAGIEFGCQVAGEKGSDEFSQTDAWLSHSDTSVMRSPNRFI